MLNFTYFAGWEGEHCQDNVDECLGSPCVNGGMCADTQGGFVCSCPFGEYNSTEIPICVHIVNWSVNKLMQFTELMDPLQSS